MTTIQAIYLRNKKLEEAKAKLGKSTCDSIHQLAYEYYKRMNPSKNKDEIKRSIEDVIIMLADASSPLTTDVSPLP